MVKMVFPSGLQRELMSQMTGGILKTEQEMDRQIDADAAVMQQESFSEEKAEPQAKEFNLPFVLCSSPTYGHKIWKIMERARCWIQATNITFLQWGCPWRCGYESRYQKQAQSWVDVEYNQDFPAIHNCQVYLRQLGSVSRCLWKNLTFMLGIRTSGIPCMHSATVTWWMHGWMDTSYFFLSWQSEHITKKRCLFIKNKKRLESFQPPQKTLRIQIQWSGPSGRLVSWH